MGSYVQFRRLFYFKILIGEFKIGNTIAKSVNKDFITLEVIFSGLIAPLPGICYLVVWYSFQFIPYPLGGFMGAAIAHAGALCRHGIRVINYAKVIPTFLFIFLRTDYRDDHRISYYDYHCKYLPEGQSL